MNLGTWIVLEITMGLVALTVIVFIAVMSRRSSSRSSLSRTSASRGSLRLLPRLEDGHEVPTRGSGRHAA
jgi:hypothetical protein